MKQVVLYHFTCLIYLPDVLSNGITRGEIPVMALPYSERPQAANLTTDPTPEGQRCWMNNGLFDKTRVRLTVRVDQSKLMPFYRAMKKFKIPKLHLKTLAPNREDKQWYFSLCGVNPKQIQKVEVVLVRSGEYVKLNESELAGLLEWINLAKSRLDINDDGAQVYYRYQNRDMISPLLDGPDSPNPFGYPEIPLSVIRRSSTVKC